MKKPSPDGMTGLFRVSVIAGVVNLVAQCLCLLYLASLDLDVHIHQRHRSRRNSRNAASLSQGLRADMLELFFHLARQATDARVIEPIGNVALLSLLQPLYGLLLLIEVTGVLDFGLD